jgi:Mce-associated membrane protein
VYGKRQRRRGEPDTDDSSRPRMSQLRTAALVGVAVVVALVAAAGWLGFRVVQTHRAEQKRAMFLEVGRQTAMTLTNVDWEHVDGDMQRLLDSSSGQFYDEMEQRSQSYPAVAKQVKAKSVGTIDGSAVKSASDKEAKVMVAVTVKASNAGVPQAAQAWRMVLTVQDNQGVPKVSNLEFIQ